MAPFHLLFALTEDPEVQDLFKDLFVPVPSFRKALRDRKPQTRIAIQEDNQFPFLAKYASYIFHDVCLITSSLILDTLRTSLRWLWKGNSMKLLGG